jgi:hypothetical protein
VGLYFVATHPSRRPSTIPRWVADNSLYPKIFTQLWQQRGSQEGDSALTEYARAASIFHCAAKRVRRQLQDTHTHVEDHLAESTAAVALLRAAQATGINVEAIQATGRRFPALLRMIKLDATGRFHVTVLNTYLEKLMANSYAEVVDSNWEDYFTFVNSRLEPRKGPLDLSIIKKQLPITREGVLGVWRTAAHMELITSKHGMAQLAADYYGVL